MKNPLNSEKLKIPAYLRKKDLAVKAKKQLLLTALDRKRVDKVAPSEAKKNKNKPSSLKGGGSETSIKNRRRRFGIPEFEMPENETKNKISIHDSSTYPEYQKKEPVKLAPIGKVIAYYPKIEVAILELNGMVKLNEVLQFSAKKFLFQQRVESMQIDRKEVPTAKKGEMIGLKVAFVPEVDTNVYKLLL